MVHRRIYASMSTMQSLEPVDEAAAGSIPASDLARMTIGEAWIKCGNDPAAMLRALQYAARAANDPFRRQLDSLTSKDPHYAALEATMWDNGMETCFGVLRKFHHIFQPTPIDPAIRDRFNAGRTCRDNQLGLWRTERLEAVELTAIA